MAMPENLTLRRAVEADQALIRHMITQEARLDPTDLHWSHFVIAEVDGQVAGLGQIRPYQKSPELGSIYTRPRFQRQGIAGAVIRRLVDEWARPGPIYLECLSPNVTFYEKFGFRRVRLREVPMPLKLKSGFGRVIGPLLGVKPVPMRLDRESDRP